MRFQLVPENRAEEQALEAYPAAQVLLGSFVPLLQVRAMMSGVRLGIFAALAEGSHDPRMLAERLGLKHDVLVLVLNMLAASGWLHLEDGRYHLSRLASETMAPGGSSPLVGWLAHSYTHWRTVAGLEECLRSGTGMDAHRVMTSSDEWHAYQLAMLETARPIAGRVAEAVPVPAGATKMLDVGGSHGLYAAMICRRHPPLRATVLELGRAVDSARELARSEGIGELVQHISGDVLHENLGEGVYDLVFMGNIIHHFAPEECRIVLRKARRALRAGGLLAVWDFWEDEQDGRLDVVHCAFALLFRIASTGRCHSPDQLDSWLSEAGLGRPARHPSPGSPHGLMTAEAPTPGL